MATKTADKTSLEIKRVIHASRARVYAAWTDPAQLKEWWGVYTVKDGKIVREEFLPRV